MVCGGYAWYGAVTGCYAVVMQVDRENVSKGLRYDTSSVLERKLGPSSGVAGA